MLYKYLKSWQQKGIRDVQTLVSITLDTGCPGRRGARDMHRTPGTNLYT